MNGTLYLRYNYVIQDYLQQGICEDVPENASAAEPPEAVRYYMPHHAVLREDKLITKLREGGEAWSSTGEVCSRYQLASLIGFLTPFTIRVKCLFQELWERGVGWDEQLPPDLTDKRVSGVQSCHSSTSWPFQDGTKSKHNHTHRYPNYTSFVGVDGAQRVEQVC